jgi:hypothetical protein
LKDIENMKNNIKTQILFGFVTQFRSERNFGLATVDDSKNGGMKRSFTLSTKNGPFLVGIKPNSQFPEFVRLSKDYPPKGARIVLEVAGVNGDMRVVGWGCAESYKKAEQIIESRRPIFRLMYRKGGVDEELVQGSAFAINAKFPRGDKDPLAKYIADEASSGGYLYWLSEERSLMNENSVRVGNALGDYLLIRRNPVTILAKESVWVETGDPRPLIQDKAKPIVYVAPVSRPTAPVIGTTDKANGFTKRLCRLDDLVLA